MPRYTMTDDHGTKETVELLDDVAAEAHARGWAAGGIYPEGTRVAVWDDGRLVVEFRQEPTRDA